MSPPTTMLSTETDHDRTGAQKYVLNLSKKVNLEVDNYCYYLLLGKLQWDWK